MERIFNIAGPCVAAKHYMLPATERLPEVPMLIRRELYFVVHAPRQSGKTTALKQLVRDINGADMAEAKERIIREHVAVLNSIRKRLDDNWMKRALGLIGRPTSDVGADGDALAWAVAYGILKESNGVYSYASPLIQEAIAHYQRGWVS